MKDDAMKTDDKALVKCADEINKVFAQYDIEPIELHDQLTPEDLWNMQRALLLKGRKFDIGSYPGDEILKSRIEKEEPDR